MKNMERYSIFLLLKNVFFFSRCDPPQQSARPVRVGVRRGGPRTRHTVGLRVGPSELCAVSAFNQQVRVLLEPLKTAATRSLSDLQS